VILPFATEFDVGSLQLWANNHLIATKKNATKITTLHKIANMLVF
jgi:hypothetical protein